MWVRYENIPAVVKSKFLTKSEDPYNSSIAEKLEKLSKPRLRTDT